MDGFEVCRKIRANHKLDKMPIIFLTAETSRESVLQGFEIGAQDYITKPFDSRELIVRVKTHISIKNQMEELEELNLSLEEKVRERTLELFKAKEKAEESDRLKSAFLMNISHEIRTPMNGILGFAQILEMKNLDDAQKLEFINLLKSSGQRLINTINDIIEISKIEAGESKVSLAEVNIGDLMQFHYNVYRHEAQAKGLDLIISGPEEEKSVVSKTDRPKLDSIIGNLMKNALKFTAKGSIELGSFVEDDSVVFYVKDSGRGIPSNRMDIIFDRFVQADDGLNRKHEGSGIGLSIVKAYVEALHGKIWVQSEVGKGSTFFFSIPVRQ
jgi:signal transduction histidine kinase